MTIRSRRSGAPRLREVLTPRRLLRLVAVGGLALAGASVVACKSGTQSSDMAAPAATPANRLLAPAAAPGHLTGVLRSSDLAVGPDTRFRVGLLDDQKRPVTDARVQVRFFKLLDQTTAQFRSEAPAPFRGSPELGDKERYVARATFDEPGLWRAELQVARVNGTTHTLRLSFEVRAQSATPAIGSPAPASRTPTADSLAEAEKICSARPVDEFHRLSIADALAERKPLVVLFATPGFCLSRTCGPDLEAVEAVAARHGDRLNVVHVEIYKGGRPGPVEPAVADWNLPSEPWLFLVGADGRIVDKFEGGVTTDELDPAVAQLVGV